MRTKNGFDSEGWKDWAQILAGLFLSAAGYRMFLIPNDIVAGGFTGVGQLVNHFTGWPVGTVSLALNVPLFVIALRRFGKRFCLRSVLGTAGLSFLLDHLPVDALTQNMLLAAVFGAVPVGAGLGLVLRGGATTGGGDLIGKLINRKLPVFTVGRAAFVLDALVIAAGAAVFDMDRALTAMICAFVLTRVMDQVLTGPGRAKAYYVISGESERIAARILSEMRRGVTLLQGMGMYSGEKRAVLMCVVSHFETVQLRRIVSGTDPRAFVIATDVYEALGEGFGTNT